MLLPHTFLLSFSMHKFLAYGKRWLCGGQLSPTFPNYFHPSFTSESHICRCQIYMFNMFSLFIMSCLKSYQKNWISFRSLKVCEMCFQKDEFWNLESLKCSFNKTLKRTRMILFLCMRCFPVKTCFSINK